MELKNIRTEEQFKRYIIRNYDLLFTNADQNGRSRWALICENDNNIHANGSINFFSNMAHASDSEYFENMINSEYYKDPANADYYNIEIENILVDLIEQRKINLIRC